MSDIVTRVRYFDKQYLRVQDFTDEQAYHLALHRRHLIGAHSWGIVSGLEIAADAEGVFVQPGYAVDGFGRELVLSARYGLPLQLFNDKRSEILDVWLKFSKRSAEPAPSGYAGCGDRGANGSEYRWIEIPSVIVEKPDPLYPNRRQPKGVADADLAFSPERTPPDDPSSEWPVFLGQIIRDVKADPQIRVDLSGRPYTGLVGESIQAPSGRATVQLGAESPNDPYRFAVFLPEANIDEDEPVLSLDASGDLLLRGDARVLGDLTLEGGALAFEHAQQPNVADPAPHGWKLYRYADDHGEQQLRIEIEQGAVPGDQKFSIGYFSAQDKKFKDVMTVDDNNQVTVQGNLTVSGICRADGGKIVGSGLTEEALAFVSSGFLTGVGGAGASLLSQPAGVQVMVNAMTDANLLSAFAAALKNTNAAAAAALRQALQ